jgi:hypothetical protein
MVSKATEMGLPNPFGTYIPQTYRCQTELQESMFAFLGFGHIPPPYAPIPPFWNGNIYSVPLYVGRIQRFLNFTEVKSL